MVRLAKSLNPPFRQQLADNFKHLGVRNAWAKQPVALLPRLRGIGAERAVSGFQFKGAQTPGMKHLND
jgi:hypothetical protein